MRGLLTPFKLNLCQNSIEIFAIKYFPSIIAIFLIANYENLGPDPLQLSRCHCIIICNVISYNSRSKKIKTYQSNLAKGKQL